MLLGYDTNFLKVNRGLKTVKEIAQQPRLWEETIRILHRADAAIQKVYRDHIRRRNVRIILTGAGSSAFAGNAIAPFLTRYTQKLIEPIPTTDIVNAPEAYFIGDTPTVLISFARSGNSPESVAAVNLGRQLIDNFKSIVITCNKNGKLAKSSKEEDLLLLMPDKSHDKGFAMTSSLTCMMTACILVLLKNDPIAKFWLHTAATKGQVLLDRYPAMARSIAAKRFKKLIFLGSASQNGIARESSLKCLELSAGLITSAHDSPMGFRHGPKSLIDRSSMVLFFLSNDPYSRQYDLDMLKEVSNEGIARSIVTLSSYLDPEAEKLSHFFINTDTADLPDALTGLTALLFTQILAVAISLRLGISPDNPSPSGTVNRVVKGVEIYPYEEFILN